MNEIAEIIKDWKAKKFKPVYWFDGEESFFLDQLMNYAEKNILTPEEASFNLSVFYGRDAEWGNIVNTCQKYPMFAERQVVLIKEMQMMKDIEKLVSYFEKPMPTTVLIVCYRGKPDGRLNYVKQMLKLATHYNFQKIKDDKVPGWIKNLVESIGFKITDKAVQLLNDHIGNDLGKLHKEIEKLTINSQDDKKISEDEIEKFTGISKEYNAFEFISAVIQKDMVKAIKIINYFEANPKSGSIFQLLPLLYGNFSKVYVAHSLVDKTDKALRSIWPYGEAYNQGTLTMRNYSPSSVEHLLLLLHEINLKALGITDGSKTTEADLMRELVAKAMN